MEPSQCLCNILFLEVDYGKENREVNRRKKL